MTETSALQGLPVAHFNESPGLYAVVVFELAFDLPAEQVWSAVVEPAALAHWFPSKVAVELLRGGRIEFSDDPNMPPTSGEVTDVQRLARFAYTWGEDEIVQELTSVDGTTTLHFVNVLGDRAAAARNAAGWTVCLQELRKHLAGSEADGPHSSSAAPWTPVYEEYVALGFPHGAPIPGRPDASDDA
ncbi:MAG: SRPBCC domain-containing protein [Segniliparus sp.]|uniref:SRPBCC domain-containing protein n=1 Tax=Segniliparus sp. TaxID=2804064 RepID=UPI003F41AE59